MHSKGDNIEMMMNDKTDEIIKELANSLKNKYQNILESMISSKFVFDCVQLLYYKSYKINRDGSYIDSLDWIKTKNVTINPVDKKVIKCF